MNALDGPAKGVQLSLRTCPTYLRLVRNRRTGKWDALDQPNDEPGASEVVYAYRMVSGTWSQMFIDYRDGAGRDGRYETGDYKWLGVVPQRAMKTRQRWIAWAKAYDRQPHE